MLDDENKQFAYEFLKNSESYHTQKENAANVIFLVEISLFSALMATSANVSFTAAVSNFRWSFVLLIVFVWCLLHVFMRWQLKNKRIAALRVATLVTGLTDHLSGDPSRAKGPTPLDTVPHSTFLDFFIPMPASAVIGDVALRSYPDWYRVRFLAAQKQGRDVGLGEIIPTYCSISMLVAALAYVLLQWR